MCINIDVYFSYLEDIMLIPELSFEQFKGKPNSKQKYSYNAPTNTLRVHNLKIVDYNPDTFE